MRPAEGRRYGMMQAKTMMLVLLLVAVGTGIGFTVGQSQTEEVRVVARSLTDGRIEFGIEHNGRRVLPASRYLNTRQIGARDDKWLRSTPVQIEVESRRSSTTLAPTGSVEVSKIGPGTSSIGWPDIEVAARNTTGKTIKALQIHWIAWDAFGDTLGCGSAKRQYTSVRFPSPKGATFSFDLSGTCVRTVDVAWGRIYAVAFTDGTNWEDPNWRDWYFADIQDLQDQCRPPREFFYVSGTDEVSCDGESTSASIGSDEGAPLAATWFWGAATDFPNSTINFIDGDTGSVLGSTNCCEGQFQWKWDLTINAPINKRGYITISSGAEECRTGWIILPKPGPNKIWKHECI